MRLWSIHPSYLDRKGLVALWREGLLARKVLRGETKGYTKHPQLERFAQTKEPTVTIDCYLQEVVKEATARGYSFDITKIDVGATCKPLLVTSGQLTYERSHVASKLAERDPERLTKLPETLAPHPLFKETEGVVETWERM